MLGVVLLFLINLPPFVALCPSPFPQTDWFIYLNPPLLGKNSHLLNAFTARSAERPDWSLALEYFLGIYYLLFLGIIYHGQFPLLSCFTEGYFLSHLNMT